jgi:hypothetical protein
MDEQLGRGFDYVSRQMCVSYSGSSTCLDFLTIPKPLIMIRPSAAMPVLDILF